MLESALLVPYPLSSPASVGSALLPSYVESLKALVWRSVAAHLTVRIISVSKCVMMASANRANVTLHARSIVPRATIRLRIYLDASERAASRMCLLATPSVNVSCHVAAISASSNVITINVCVARS